MHIDPTWPEWVLRQDFACVFVRAPTPAAAVEIAAKLLGHMRGWEVGSAAVQEVFRCEEYATTRAPATTPGRSSTPLARSHRRAPHDLNPGQWFRHVATLPLVVAGAWYGVEQASRGALVLADAGALASFAWPEASRFLSWLSDSEIDPSPVAACQERHEPVPSRCSVPAQSYASDRGLRHWPLKGNYHSTLTDLILVM